VIRANKKMVDELDGIGPEDRMLPVQLLDLLRQGFCEHGGCYFLRGLFERSTNVTIDNFIDKTGYECFINSIHIDDYVSHGYIAHACDFVTLLFDKWIEFSVGIPLQSIMSSDEFGVNIKFHLLRDGESFVAEDVEKYDDPIIVWDSRSTINQKRGKVHFLPCDEMR